jgi:hypothetical protein
LPQHVQNGYNLNLKYIWLKATTVNYAFQERKL